MQPPAISGLTSHRRNIRLCITRSPPSVSHKSAFWFIFPPTPFYHIHHPSSIGIFHNKFVHNLCTITNRHPEHVRNNCLCKHYAYLSASCRRFPKNKAFPHPFRPRKRKHSYFLLKKHNIKPPAELDAHL